MKVWFKFFLNVKVYREKFLIIVCDLPSFKHHHCYSFYHFSVHTHTHANTDLFLVFVLFTQKVAWFSTYCFCPLNNIEKKFKSVYREFTYSLHFNGEKSFNGYQNFIRKNIWVYSCVPFILPTSLAI